MVACWSKEITALQRVPDLEEAEERSKDNRQALDKAHDPVTPMPLHDPAGQKKRESRRRSPTTASSRSAFGRGRRLRCSDPTRAEHRRRRPDCADDVAQLGDANPV